MTPTTVRLSLPTFQQLWAYEGHSRQHPALTVSMEWLDEDERTKRVEEMFAELADNGLATDGQPIPSLRAVLAAVASPKEEFFGFFDQLRDGRRDTFSALAVRDEHTAVLAIMDNSLLELRPVEPHALGYALIDLALPCPARPGESLAITADELDADGRAVAPPAEDFDDIHEPEPSEPARKFERLLHEPRLAVGQLYTAHRDRKGLRHRCRHPLTYIDTHTGRVYTTMTRGPRGDGWIAVPATQEQLAKKLLELRDTLPES